MISAVTDPVNIFYSALLIAFLSGSIIFNVFKEEIPSDKESSYPAFLSGALITAALLVFMAIIKTH